MTPQELYEWTIEHEAQGYDLLINGVALDYDEPNVDHGIGAIDITTPYTRW